MPSTRFLAQFYVNGVLIDPDSAVFADANTPTYGVKRTDTNAVVVAAGTALTRLSIGTFYYDFTDPAPDLTYQWAVRWVRSGKANAYGYFTTKGATSSVPVSVLFTWQRFVNAYGLQNIIKLTQKDRTTNTGGGTTVIPPDQPNWETVQDAFNYATDEVYGNLRGGVLAVPLDFTLNGGVVPPRIEVVAMTIAYDYLYGFRRTEENPKSKAGDYLDRRIQSAMMTLAMMKAGTLQVPEAAMVGDLQVKVPSAIDVWKSQAGWRYADGQFVYLYPPITF